jgi:peptide-methionine (R)-S-oxide reductase
MGTGMYLYNNLSMKWIDVLQFAKQGSPAPDKRVDKSAEEWRRELSEVEFHIMRQKGTERAFTGEYCEAHEPGLYACRGCNTLLFDSTQKFESGSGWPSFTIPVKPNAIKYEEDISFGMTRVEVMCNACDAHLGHVFPDGPPPTGLRYCINSASIKHVNQETI